MPRAQFYSHTQLGEIRAEYKRRTKWEKWGGNAVWYESLPASTAELAKMVQNVRRQTVRRINSLKNKETDSFAAFKLGKDLEKYMDRYTDRADRNALEAELAVYHQFWASKGSTVSGAKEINREQDIRIFGAEEHGAVKIPVYTMNKDERERFWEAYMEFMNQHPEKNTRDNSERIQRLIGGYMELVTVRNYSAIIEKVEEKLKESDTNVSEEEKKNREWFRKHFE